MYSVCSQLVDGVWRTVQAANIDLTGLGYIQHGDVLVYLHQPENIDFPVAHIDQTGVGHPGVGFGNLLVTLYPFKALYAFRTVGDCRTRRPSIR